MLIQSKKVWIADQFIPAAIEMNDGKITGVFPYGTKEADVDYGDKRIVPGFIDIHCHGASDSIQTMQTKKGFAHGQKESFLKVQLLFLQQLSHRVKKF